MKARSEAGRNLPRSSYSIHPSTAPVTLATPERDIGTTEKTFHDRTMPLKGLIALVADGTIQVVRVSSPPTVEV